MSFGAPHPLTPDWWYICDENVSFLLRSSKDEIDTSSPRRTRYAFSRCPSHWRDFDQIQLHVKWIYLYLILHLSDHERILLIPRQHNCLRMDKVILWLKQFSLNYPKDKFHRITILIELSLVERMQGPCWERCTTDTRPPLSLTPLAPCCVWWWRHNCLRKTFWDPAIVMGMRMIDLTRWMTISFMMTFTTGHIKFGNF